MYLGGSNNKTEESHHPHARTKFPGSKEQKKSYLSQPEYAGLTAGSSSWANLSSFVSVQFPDQT